MTGPARRELGREVTDRRIAALVAGALFAALLTVHSGHMYSIDGLEYYRSADRLVTAGSLTLDPPIVWAPGRGIHDPGGPPGFAFALAPAVALASNLRSFQPPLTTLPYDMRLLYGDVMYAAVSWVNPLLASLTAAVVVLIVRRLGAGRRLAVAGGFATVLSGPLLWYARADFAQPLAAFLLSAAILIVLRIRFGERGRWLLVPIIAWAVLTRPVDGALTAVVVVAGLLAPDPRPGLARWRPVDLLATGLGFGLGIAVNLVVNAARRGNPFAFGYGDGFTGFLPTGLLAYVLSPGRALVWYLPLTALAVVGAVRLWRGRERLALVVLGLPFVLWLPVYAQWVGLSGWAYGPRFLVPLVPLSVSLAVVAVARSRSRRMRRSFVALAGGGAVLAVSAVVVDQLRFVGVIGVNAWGTPGYWLEFTPAAYAPVASWAMWAPTSIANAADVIWLRSVAATGGLSLVPMALFGVIAILLTRLAFRPGLATATELRSRGRRGVSFRARSRPANP